MTPIAGRLDRPIFIVSTPRSGSTLLFETLAQAPKLFTIGHESHWLIEDIADFHPAKRGWESNRLTGADALPQSVEALAAAFYHDLRDRGGSPADGRVRMLEKTPKNALRVPFLAAAFPDAMFVYLYRDVRQSLASMMEAWASGAFQTYPRLPAWSGYPWSLLLVPGWRELVGKSLPQIVAHQWARTTTVLLDDLGDLPAERLRVVDFDHFTGAPEVATSALAESLDLEWDRPLGKDLPLSKTTVSQPRPDKWRRLEPIVAEVMPIVADADSNARQFVERARG